MNRLMVFDNHYFQKTYAGWLGKIIGIRLGSPIEGWSAETIEKVHGEITGYLVNYKDYAADDDSNGPLFFVRSLMDFSYEIDKITPREMGLTWLNYIAERHGFIWWGGYGVSTEHTAYENLKFGIDAPRSGSIELNGAACAEQIGGQIFSDCWGFVAPGNPVLAARYAEMMASVSHDGEGIHGGRFVAACVSHAYVAQDVLEIIETGLSVIPDDCEYARVVRAVRDFFHADASEDWKACFRFVREEFGYDKYPGNCHIIPNAAVVVLSLLYGKGDFSSSQYICNMCGWDTDCNAGNVGAVVGTFAGIEGIDDKWIGPINDLLISSSVLGGLNIDTVSSTAELFGRLGIKIAGASLPEPWEEKETVSSDRILRFDHEKSTQSFRTACDRPQVEAALRNVADGRDSHRALLVTANRLADGNEMKVFLKTYYRPGDLHDSRYDPGFTPIAFPGQTVTTAIKNEGEQPLRVSIYAGDLNSGTILRSDLVTVGGSWSDLTFRIPALPGSLLGEVGLLVSKKNPENGNHGMTAFKVDYFGITGTPDYDIDFSKERMENFGFGHGGFHREVSQFTYRNGLWELDDDELSGSCYEEGEVYTGLYGMKDAVIRCDLCPVSGFHHQMNFRVQGGARSYAFGFCGPNTVAFLKKDRNYSVMEQADFSYVPGGVYRFQIDVRGGRFALSINDEPVLEAEDPERTYRYGQVGLSVRNGSHCHFRHLRTAPL